MGWTYDCAKENHKECPDTKKDSYQCDCPCHLTIEVTPTCDICGRPDGAGVPDWNGETGNHLSCEIDVK